MALVDGLAKAMPGRGLGGGSSHRHRGVWLGVLAPIAAGCLLALLPAAAEAGRVPGFGCLGVSSCGVENRGSGNGQFLIPKGIAVNRTGAGGGAPGDVYVVDEQNGRVSQFSGSGTFIRSFGADVVESGPDNASEIQSVTVKATAGTFRLTFGTSGTTTTGATGTGDVAASSSTVENVTAATGAFVQGEAIAGPGIPAGTTIAAVGAGTLTLSQAATATTAGAALTADLPFDAPAVVVRSALDALTAIGSGGGSVTVSGGPGDSTGSTPYVVSFDGGPLKGANVAQMTSANGYLPLGGGSGPGASLATITTTNSGATGFEICGAADVCKQGLLVGNGAAVAGALRGATGIAIDQATGNVYVTSVGNKRIDVFSANGAFEGAFGWEVRANATTGAAPTLQLCTFATGCKAGIAGSAAGQLGFDPTLNSMPAVDPNTGNLFVPDTGNERMDEFSPALDGAGEIVGVSFVHAFGFDVVPTVDERQAVTVSGASSGTFKLSFDGQTTGATGTGNLESGSSEVTELEPASSTFVAGEAISGPGIPPGSKVTAVTFDSLTLSNAATETAASAPLAAELPFDASASTVQGALRALSTIGTPNATVSGGPAGSSPLTVELGGPLAGSDQPQIACDASGLIGGAPSCAVSTLVDGANGTGTGLEQCTAATTCKAGITPGGENVGALRGLSSAAVDSTGAIYVTSTDPTGGCGRETPVTCRVQKFNPAGTMAEEFAPAQLTPAIFSESDAVAPTDVAVDPTDDHVLVAKKIATAGVKFFEFTRSGELLDATPAGERGLEVAFTESKAHGLAIGTGGRAYFSDLNSSSQPPQVYILNTPPAPSATIEPAGEVGSTTATFHGVVTPSAPGLEGGFPTAYYFEYSTDGVAWSKTEEFDAGDGTGSGNPNSCPEENPPSCLVSQKVSGLQAGANYLVRLVASNGTRVRTETKGFSTASLAPTVSRTVAEHVMQTSATLTARIDPNNEPTTYHFEWGHSTAYGSRIPADFDAVAGSGGQPVRVTASLTDLEPNTHYHFRVIATSAAGTTEGPDQEFVTLDEAGLPDSRAAELVSPADKRPQGFVGNVADRQVYEQASTDGSAFAYQMVFGVPDATTGGNVAYMAVRDGSTGWHSTQVSAPTLSSTGTGEAGATSGSVLYYSPNLDCGVLVSDQPLTSDTPAVDTELGVKNLYRWTRGGAYTLLSNRVPLNPEFIKTGGFTGYYTVAGASPDCNRIYFQSVYKLFSGGSELYEWDEGALRDAGLLPDGSTPSGEAGGPSFPFSAVPGGDFKLISPSLVRGTLANAVPPDGSRLFFTATSDHGLDSGRRAIFVRGAGGAAPSTDASQSATATASLGARYEGASPDGSHVFFIANYGLAATSSPGPSEDCSGLETAPYSTTRCDLYDYDVAEQTLTDLSADANPADPKGAVAEGVVAVSKDGSYVYFAAMGQLIPGEGKTYAQNLGGSKSANLYLAHDGSLAYIATLEGNDLNGEQGADLREGGALVHDEPTWTAQATPDGHHLLFTSKANITGYSSGGPKEAYLYSADSGTTTCVSCRPDGQPSLGSAKVGPIASINEQGDSNHNPRSLSDDGRRVFFTSKDPLAPGAVAGRENVYEWENGQVYLLAVLGATFVEGEYLDASASGDDVFVSTQSQLVPEDIDFVTDVYDLKVGGGFAPESSPPPCVPSDEAPTAQQCQGPATPPPASPGSASEGASGAGNAPTPRPRRHHKKKHRHGRRRHRAAKHGRGGAR